MEKKRVEVMGSLSLLLVAVIWGTGFIASQMALDANLSSAFIMFVRFAIAALIVGLVFHRDLKQQLKKEHWKGGFLIGTFLFFAFYVQTVALQYTTPSNNAFITAANVVMVPFLWWAVSRKKPGTKYILSSFLCLIGIGILSVNLSSGISFQIGDLLTLRHFGGADGGQGNRLFAVCGGGGLGIFDVPSDRPGLFRLPQRRRHERGGVPGRV